MAIMVPETADRLAGRRFEAKRRVWTELRDQLPEDHVVFTLTPEDGGPAPDFVVLGPNGLVHIASSSGILDVVSPPGPGIVWTHRGEDGYFIGGYPSDDLQHAAEALEQRLLSVVPSCHLRQPEEVGRGLLHVLPDTTPNYTPGIDLASPDRRVLVTSDLGRLGEWVRRAGTDRPAAPVIKDGLRRELEMALSDMAQPAARRRQGLFSRRGLLLAAGAAVVLILALLSERVGSGPSLPHGREKEFQDGHAIFALPAFIPPKAEWAVKAAMDVAWDSPDRAVRWRHGEVRGSVQQLPHDGRTCRAFRVSLDQGDAMLSEDRRYCR